MAKRLGRSTFRMDDPPSALGFAAAGGKKEGEGPLGGEFDLLNTDTSFGEETWEKAESRLQLDAVRKALEKAALSPKEIDLIFAGDLLNQCLGSTYGLRALEIPFLGVYGACSTMAESLCLASLFVDSRLAEQAVAVTSSHFCSAERQFRFPLEYGGQWPPTMGAAMAPAAASTFATFFKDTGTRPEDYDRIFTGDLGKVGSMLLLELLQEEGYDLSRNHEDCGLLLYSPEQDVHAGGSGCGCSASVLCAHILPRLRKGEYKEVLFAATGALMSPTLVQQGESIPGIAHLIHFSSKKEE